MIYKLFLLQTKWLQYNSLLYGSSTEWFSDILTFSSNVYHFGEYLIDSFLLLCILVLKKYSPRSDSVKIHIYNNSLTPYVTLHGKSHKIGALVFIVGVQFQIE